MVRTKDVLRVPVVLCNNMGLCVCISVGMCGACTGGEEKTIDSATAYSCSADTGEGQGDETQSRIIPHARPLAETSCPSHISLQCLLMAVLDSVGEQAKAFLKRLGRRLARRGSVAIAKSWDFFGSRMAGAILRASSQRLRGPRTKIKGTVCTD
jgi:hypothetical protein